MESSLIYDCITSPKFTAITDWIHHVQGRMDENMDEIAITVNPAGEEITTMRIFLGLCMFTFARGY